MNVDFSFVVLAAIVALSCGQMSGTGMNAYSRMGASSGMGAMMLPMILNGGMDARSLMLMSSMNQGAQGGSMNSMLPYLAMRNMGSENIFPLIMMMKHLRGSGGGVNPMMLALMMNQENMALPFLMMNQQQQQGPVIPGAPAGAAISNNHAVI